MGHLDTQFEIIEVKSDNGKNYYLEGFVSTTDPDLVNDIVTINAQKKVLNQLNTRFITIDDDHDSFRDPKTGEYHNRTQHKLPIGLIVKSELRETSSGSIGNWVRVKLNKDHPLFEKYLNSIKNHFVHSFSIAYKPIKAMTELINGVKYRLLDDLNILNVCITGNPVNTTAEFSLALKSLPIKMEEKLKLYETEIADLKSKNVELESELTQLKGCDYKKMYEELKAEVDKKKVDDEEEAKKKKDDEQSEMKSLSTEMADLKSVVEVLKKENAELKSFVESPQLKSIVEGKSISPAQTATKAVTMWDVM